MASGSRIPRRAVRWAALAAGGGWALAWLVNRSLVEVRGPSMLPTLTPGERLLTVPARLWPVRAGDVAVVDAPGPDGPRVVKRVTRVGSGRVEVHGDNPPASTDSRAWGPLPRRALRRVALLRWPRPARHGLRRLDAPDAAGAAAP